MQLTRFTDYSLRVLMFLARRDGSHTTIRDIADAHEVSENHLMKVVHTLSRRGYVITVRGKGGGVELARDAADISIGSVVRDVEALTTAECFIPGYGAACKLYPGCRLRGVLQGAQSAFLAILDGYSIGDVAGSRRVGVPGLAPAVRRRRVAR